VLLVTTLTCLLVGGAAAQSIIIEAETYVASHNEGGEPITVAFCGAASGGRAVDGYDWPGDWIEVLLTVDENGAFADSMRSAGLRNEVSTHRSTVYGGGPVGENLVSDFTTIGLGIG
jgi:hypothetical protein